MRPGGSAQMTYALRLLILIGALGAFAFLAGCDRDRLAVVVRPCVVEGSPWTSNVNRNNRYQVTEDGAKQLYSAIETTQRIWEAGADVSMLVVPGRDDNIPVIGDPVRPGTQTETGAIAKNLGEVYQGQGIASRPSAEVEAAVAECDQAWARAFPDGLQGLPLIFVSAFTRDDGVVDSSLLGFGPTINGSPALCNKPYQIGPPMVAGRFILVRTNWPANETGQRAFVGHTLAHEFGHALLLRHGDGIDNNGDGLWDSGCDASGEAYTDGENGGPRSLMLPRDQASEVISPLQREVARLAAKQYPGTLGNAP